MPFSVQYKGSYFGDEDTFKSIVVPNCPESFNLRESTSVAMEITEILSISKSSLFEVLDQFPTYKSEMIRLTKEKKRYYKFLKHEVAKRYLQNDYKDELIKMRLNQLFITTHMSLKR